MTDTSGATSAPDAAAQAAAAAAATAAERAAQASAEQQREQGGDQQQQLDPWNDPEKARREIERLRRENGDARIKAKEQAAEEARKELLQNLTKALDPNAADGQPKTAEQLTQTLATVQSTLEQTSAENTLLSKRLELTREAWRQGVDPKKLGYLEYTLTQSGDFTALDSTAADFSAKLSGVITQAITEDSSLKLSGAAVGTGAETFGGANGSTATLTKEQFAALPVSEKNKLFLTNRSEFDRLTAL